MGAIDLSPIAKYFQSKTVSWLKGQPWWLPEEKRFIWRSGVYPAYGISRIEGCASYRQFQMFKVK
jgi:hypothetical protein